MVRIMRMTADGDLPPERARVLSYQARGVLEAFALEMAQVRIVDLLQRLEELKSLRALSPTTQKLLPALRDIEQASEVLVQDVEPSRKFDSDSGVGSQRG